MFEAISRTRKFCNSLTEYSRYKTKEVYVGDIPCCYRREIYRLISGKLFFFTIGSSNVVGGISPDKIGGVFSQA